MGEPGQKFNHQPTDIERAQARRQALANEKKRVENERQHVMRRLLELCEAEIKKTRDLTLFAGREFHRSTFVDREKHLHVVDEIDGMVNWLNQITDDRFTKLVAEGVTPETLQADLYAIGENFFALAKEVNVLKSIQLDLSGWVKEFRDLVRELYETIQGKNGEITYEQQTKSLELSGEIQSMRIDLVGAVNKALGIDEEEWMHYVNEHA